MQLIVQEFLEAEVSAKLGREKGDPRHICGKARVIDWRCGHCGCQDANQFTREGQYQRNRETGWGHLRNLRVPMVEGQKCRHDVLTEFAILEKYKRYWIDLDQNVLVGSGFCESLRHLQERWSATVEGSVGLRTLNERLHLMEPLARGAHTAPITQVPSVLHLDGIWVTIHQQQEKIKPDKRKRQRHLRTGSKMGVLVALGFWPDGRREILDGQIARSQDHQEWEVLVQRLWERGCRPEQGLPLVVRDGSGGLGEALALVYGRAVPEQRCLFHKLQK